MYRLTIIFFLLFIQVKADSFSFKEIESMPKSISKDYYIWRFLQEKNTTKNEALKSYQLTKRKSYKLKKAIRKKVGYLPKDESTPESKKDSSQDPKNYIIYPSTAGKKSKKSLRRLYKKIKKQGKYSDVLKVMANKKPFEALKSVTPKTACYIFNGCETKYRKRYFNHQFSKEQLLELAKEKQFNKTIFKTVTTHALQKTKKSLLFTPPTEVLSFKSLFLLAINAVEFKNREMAIGYLLIANERTKSQSKKDQSNFWLYLLTKEETYLQSLLNSSQINLYTLSARDILKKPYPKVITPNLTFRLIEHIDPYSPIDWENIKIAMKKEPKKMNQLADKYNSYATEGIYCYLKEKASGYTKPYYAMPYRDAMIGIEKHRVALLYALGRQESRFVPASISTSYALGMMQIMPFLIKHLAKERGKKLDLNEMFNPYTAISYANQHLDYLTKYLYHPLFIAYAYNGGIGFTRRTIRSKHLFKTGMYEPYLSMELIDYEEAKEYGKKVLVNYIIYLNQIGVNTRVTPFLDILDKPLETDKFR
jgi:soluble lytic murein transglycosylase